MDTRYAFLADIPAEEYHEAARKGEYLSSHLLADFRKCPRLYRKKVSGEIPPADSPALLMGRAVHTLVLEGRAKFDTEFLVSEGPVNPKTGEPFGRLTEAYRDWLSQQRLPVVSGPDYDFMLKIRSAVWSHETAARLLDRGVAEKTVRTEYAGMMCQIRMDWFCGEGETPVICDLKTCDTVDYFEQDAWKFGYPHQMAFYREVFACACEAALTTPGVRPDCYLIAVEKREPFRVAVYKLTDALLEQCAHQNEAAVAELMKCQREGEWPTRTEGMRILDA